jgi:uncharacterized membrane protein HdeD (DUF308 family)
MMIEQAAGRAVTSQEQWLKTYYFTRAAFSAAWFAAALAIGQRSPAIGAFLLVVYPLWDAAANYVDASRSGGLIGNPTQVFNVVVSLATALGVAVALSMSMNRVLAVFGAWAVFAGLLQLGTAIRRWKRFGAQWAMVLSGAQSALAGGFFIFKAGMPASPSIADVAGYAAVGAFYFLVSAVWLTVRDMRKSARTF